MLNLSPIDALRAVLTIRAALPAARDHHVRARLRESEQALRNALRPGVPKTVAATILGISLQALDGWVRQGVIPVVERPGVRRHTIETTSLIELAEAVDTVRRREGGHRRRRVAAAVRSLGWDAARSTRPRVISEAVASLPRPNVSERELREHALATSPRDRVHELAALSQALNAIAGRGARRAEGEGAA